MKKKKYVKVNSIKCQRKIQKHPRENYWIWLCPKCTVSIVVWWHPNFIGLRSAYITADVSFKKISSEGIRKEICQLKREKY